MIILDTNVISEPLRRRPHPVVVSWLDAQVVETLFLTAISPPSCASGSRCGRGGSTGIIAPQQVEEVIVAQFAGRILPFDDPASAAIHRFAVATRDTAPFVAAGLRVVDPFSV